MPNNSNTDDSKNRSGNQRRGGSGNFANNPERAREAGRKGGKASGGNR